MPLNQQRLVDFNLIWIIAFKNFVIEYLTVRVNRSYSLAHFYESRKEKCGCDSSLKHSDQQHV